MTTLQISFVSESAGYQNTLGWYNSRTGEAGIIFLNTNDDGRNASISSGDTALLEVDQADLDAGYIGFFLIPNGALRYGTGEDSVLSGPLSFDTKGNGDGKILDADGHNLTGAQGEVIFSDPALNKKDVDYTQGDDDGSILGQIAFEDQVKKSDRDFNDLVIDVQVYNPNRPPVVEDQVFEIAENPEAGTVVGQVLASDPDADGLAFEIVSGNDNGAFAIDAATGAITVADPSKFDFEDPALSAYALTVRVTDNGALSDTAVVRIGVTDVVETLIGTPGNDFLAGGAGDDVLLGLQGNDTLIGRGGDDVLNGGEIADLQSDAGFRDNDRVDYSLALSGVVVNLQTGIASDDGEGGVDTLIGIEAVTGSAFNDVLIGADDTFSESFRGGAGDDHIDGGGGNDRAEYDTATAGISVVAAGFGSSTITVTGDFSVGEDTLTDVELILGSNFADSYDATGFVSNSGPGGSFSTFNGIEGRGGDDSITGNGNTRIEYGSATSGVTVDLAAGTASGDASVGLDTFSGVNQVRGSGFADVLRGGNPLSDGFESFDGRRGNDFIDGGSGWDRADYAFNGPVAAGIQVDLAAGTVIGDPAFIGTDTLRNVEAIRGTHRDDVYDATGFSAFSANSGWFGTLNEFEGMAGNDTVIGNGNTRIGFGSARESVIVDLEAGTVTGGASVGSDTILGGVFEVRGSSFDDTLIGSLGADRLFGGAGDDLLRGGQGVDFLDGGPGSDRFDYDAPWEGDDTIFNFTAGPGGDVIDVADLLADWTTYGGGAGGVLDNFVVLEAVGANALLRIDVDGAGGPQFFQTLATLVGAGGFSLAFLLDNGNLEVGPAGGVPGVTITGTPGNDFLEGGPGDDTLIGDLGNDFLRGNAGNDLLDGFVIADLQSDIGFRDNDRVDYSTSPAGVTVDLETGIASDGWGGLDTLIGIEAVTGSAFNDVLIGADDTFSESFRGGAGDDFIDGGGGNDLSEYFDATGAITVNLGFGDTTATVSGDASVGFDTLVDVERFQGTAFGDSFFAGGYTGGFNSFEGRGGDDQIFGNGATRIEYTGATSGVTVDLALGQATGDASVGTDTFFGVSQVRGSAFADTFLGAAFFSDESFDGRGGNDFIDGRAGFDRADYAFNGPISVGISVNLAAGTVVGDPVFTGTDTLRSIEAIRGSHKDDVYDARGFSGGSVNAGSFNTLNEFEGMAGNDTVWGNGNTRLAFANAREAVSVDLAAGTVTGGASVGNDMLMGGINQMRGSSFDDVLQGSNHGITSAEVYEGRRGNDTYSGRGGYDQARYDSDPTQAGIAVVMAAINANTGTVTGDAAIGMDTLIDIVAVVGTLFDDIYDGTGYFSSVSGLASFNEFEGLGGNDIITGNASTRVSYISSWDGVTVDLAAGTASGIAIGNDTLINVFNVRGSNFADTLTGSFGNDTFEGRGGDDFIDGGAGSDLVRYDNGSFGGGSFIANAAGIVMASVPGHDTDTLVSIELIRGSNFGDVFDASASIAGFTFDGRGGNDTLIGSQGPNLLQGGDGNDLLRGGLGADTLEGGAGSDTFDFDLLAEGGDVVTDFAAVPGGDVLDIADLLAASTSYAGGPIEEYVRLQPEGPHSQVQIDVDGVAGVAGWQTLATLLNTPGLTLETLVDQGNLDTLI